MNFTEAVSTCFRKYAVFSGRAKRSEYWWFYLFAMLATTLFQIIDNAFETSFLGVLVSCALFLPSLAVGSRRLHDIGKSGWWQLISFTGIGIFLLIFWFAQDTRE